MVLMGEVGNRSGVGKLHFYGVFKNMGRSLKSALGHRKLVLAKITGCSEPVVKRREWGRVKINGFFTIRSPSIAKVQTGCHAQLAGMYTRAGV